MQIQPIQPSSPSFGIYKGTRITHYGSRDTGIFKNTKLDIYTVKDEEKLDCKLYYLADKAGNGIKSKLVYFSGNKKAKVIKGVNKNL